MVAKRVATVLPLIGLLLATGLVVVLARQLDAARQQRDLLAQRAQSLQPGAYVPLHSAPTVAGPPVALGEVAPGTRQVLFVYNTRCAFCLATIPTWQRIADRYRDSPRVKVVAVSLDSLQATATYARRHGLRYPSAVLTDPRTTGLFRFNSVPQTLVIVERGRVMHSRVGLLKDGVAADSVLAAIARPLPGTTTTARSAPSARAPG
ncbi:MAG: TlpA family protein disulfide reductase [Gemmatimonadetes bacterium]|nr:TlpA family protein disulfide reductase [Gemmatimonadota bacterium]